MLLLFPFLALFWVRSRTRSWSVPLSVTVLYNGSGPPVKFTVAITWTRMATTNFRVLRETGVPHQSGVPRGDCIVLCTGDTCAPTHIHTPFQTWQTMVIIAKHRTTHHHQYIPRTIHNTLPVICSPCGYGWASRLLLRCDNSATFSSVRRDRRALTM